MASSIRSVVFLGTTDDVTTCECCGRSELKSTVALSIDEGDAVYFGVTCAARALKMGIKEVRASARAADDARAAAEKAARDIADRAEDARWQAWLDARAGVATDRFRQIEKLGGFKAARAAYESEAA